MISPKEVISPCSPLLRVISTAVFRFKGGSHDEEKILCSDTGLKEEGGEFRIVYGSVASSDQEIALLTHNITEILSDISSTVEVPAEHVAEKRAPPTMESEGQGVKGPMIRILCSREKPGDDFAAVPYRNRWFWIDDRDYSSKKLFSFLMFIMTLTETGGKEGAPIVTISAGGS